MPKIVFSGTAISVILSVSTSAATASGVVSDVPHRGEAAREGVER